MEHQRSTWSMRRLARSPRWMVWPGPRGRTADPATMSTGVLGYHPLQRKPEMTSDTIFSWLHLSDIHIGHGTPDHHIDQRLILDALVEDVKRHPFPIDALIITGDVAFSGGALSEHEYSRAGKFIDEVLQAAHIERSNVFFVPGNHDVVREPKGTPTYAVLKQLRDGTSIDDSMGNVEARNLLSHRFRSYLEFVCKYNPGCGALWWSETRRARANLSIRLVGLNSAILCNDDEEREKLQIGKEQIAELVNPQRDGQELTIVLAHHPLEWLNPSDAARGWIKSSAHVVLHGHLHDPESELSFAGGGGAVIRVSAGATHAESVFRDDKNPRIQDRLPPFGQGYNIGLLRAVDSKLRLDITPRSWSARRKRFQLDVDNVPEGQSCSMHVLPMFRVDPLPGFQREQWGSDVATPSVPRIFDATQVESLASSLDSAAAERLRAVEAFLKYVADRFEQLFDLKRNSLDVHPLFKELKQRLDTMTPGIVLHENEGILERARVRHVILRTQTLIPIVRQVPRNSLEEVARSIGRGASGDLIREVLIKHCAIPSNPAAFVALWDFWDRTGGWGKLTLESSGDDSTPTWRIHVTNSFLTVADDLELTHALASFWCGYIHGFLENALPEIERLMATETDSTRRGQITFPAYVTIEDVRRLPDESIETDVFEIRFKPRAFSISLALLAKSSEAIARQDYTSAMALIRAALDASRVDDAQLEADERDACLVVRDVNQLAWTSETMARRSHAAVNGIVSRLAQAGGPRA